MIISEYTGGVKGWRTLISKCPDCGEIIAEYYVDKYGIPTDPIFDETPYHVCDPAVTYMNEVERIEC